MSAEQLMFIGTNASEHGIFASKFNLESGKFSEPQAVGDAPRPSFLAMHPTLPMLYAVTRESTKPSGGVRAFQISFEDGSLALLNQQSTGDQGPTHLEVTPDGKALLVANYSGGSTTLLPLDDTGQIGPLSALVKHQGSSVNPKRQRAPFAHGVAISRAGRFACVADLGTDEVIVYRIVGNSKLSRVGAWKALPGAGPRHLAFHPQQPWLYSINELDSTLSALKFDVESGQLNELQTLNTLPTGFTGKNTTAEVVVHPSGKFVYISNRGHDSTAAFSIDPESGKLALIEIESTLGDHPRFIGIEPSGQFLIAANRDANNLVSFRIDATTGKLEPTGHQITIKQPVCVVFPQQEQ